LSEGKVLRVGGSGSPWQTAGSQERSWHSGDLPSGRRVQPPLSCQVRREFAGLCTYLDLGRPYRRRVGRGWAPRVDVTHVPTQPPAISMRRLPFPLGATHALINDPPFAQLVRRRPRLGRSTHMYAPGLATSFNCLARPTTEPHRTGGSLGAVLARRTHGWRRRLPGYRRRPRHQGRARQGGRQSCPGSRRGPSSLSQALSLPQLAPWLMT
jgi:hypothetical protein